MNKCVFQCCVLHCVYAVYIYVYCTRTCLTSRSHLVHIIFYFYALNDNILLHIARYTQAIYTTYTEQNDIICFDIGNIIKPSYRKNKETTTRV